ncbi:NirD/YgiW/YdeI family stress tolerance protein [Pasteurellaceae bacterium LIM206]|nr:NirD/YgiW/YdeI family stress tolerance protein [Pasteurellaceae bacterium LIM206]
MKVFVFLLLFSLSGTLPAQPDSTHEPVMITTVEQAFQAENDENVTLTGYIIKRIEDDNKFLFQDNTGNLEIQVDDNAWSGQNIRARDNVTIYGQMNSESPKKPLMNVKCIRKN